ncbi:hypothetical protein [Streptomyces sp. NPDC059176]|uniref:hypothetical protein n=1 Tax=unclassified Streptomyces TaxID=2593676 RepID=UPI0036C3053E
MSSRVTLQPQVWLRVARRTTEGKTKREIIRCLKRCVIREVYHLIRPATNRAPAS